MTQQDDITQRVLPCPFCGSEAFETFKTDDDGIRRHSVHCKALNCGGQTRDRHFSEAEAIAAWNRRAALASAPVAAQQSEPSAEPWKLLWEDIMAVAESTGKPTPTMMKEWAWRLRRCAESAPVAGEAQPLGYVRKGREWPNQCYYPSSHKPTDIHNWTPVFDHAAPQPSAYTGITTSDHARNAALEALEAAQRFIRNGIELGYIRMPDADTPDPAQRTPDLIDAAIRALKQSQADKDGDRAALGVPECGGPICGSKDHHPLCRCGWDVGGGLQRAALSATQADDDALDVDALANAIRSIDGKHTTGAGALAEALMPFIKKMCAQALGGDTERLDFLVAHRAWVGWSKDRECCAVYRRDDEGYTEPMTGWTPSYLTPREAIDAAKAAQERKGGAA